MFPDQNSLTFLTVLFARGGFRGGPRGPRTPLLSDNFFFCKQCLSDSTSCFVILDIFSAAPDDRPCHKCNCGT